MAEEFDPYAIVDRNDGEYDLTDSIDTYNLEGFRPGDGGGPDCTDRQAWGAPSTIYSYIFKGNIDQEKYPQDACSPYYHYTAQIDFLRVNDSIEGPDGTGPFTMNSSLVTIPNGDIVSYQFGVPHFLSLKKNFDIPHPTKEGWRLRHTCPEGPSNDVYIRGKIEGKNIIKLPEYWNGLVDPETITVSLTCIGKHQPLSYEIKWGREVHITNADAGHIHCSYTIFGERKDGERLIPEYEGTSPADYPGNNDEYSVVGYNYDKRS